MPTVQALRLLLAEVEHRYPLADITIGDDWPGGLHVTIRDDEWVATIDSDGAITWYPPAGAD